MGYDYSDQEVTKRVSSGKDKGRKATADKLFAQATQPPHDEDAAALGELQRLSTDFATMDAKNYSRMLLNRVQPGSGGEYGQAHDGSFNLGHAIGGALKFAAPIAGMAIPGLGTLGALAVGGLGSQAGNMLQGNGFSVKGALLNGAAAAGGNALLGNQGFKGLGGVPQRLGIGGGAAPAIGNATQSMAGAAAPAAAGSGGGIGGAIAKLGGIGNIAKAGVGVGAMLDSRAQRQAAERMGNAQLDLYNRQLGMAEQDYNSRAPLRNAALQRLGTLAQRPMANSIYGG